MSDGTGGGGSTYGYDPFGGKTQGRWGRRTKTDLPIPEIPGYEVVDHLGSGGMGSVWSARFLALNQLRAVKVLDKALARDPQFLERFGQEAKALGRLDHPNVVKVYDANAENDPPYIAMDWVEGRTLTEVMGGRPMAIKDALPLFYQIAAALDYAHGNGFIHRDLKPSNVMVTREGKAMLIDFGVASWLGSEVGEGHTLTGTTRYLSPETIQGRPVTTASDLWAFAVIMFRVLTGSLPFDGRDGDSVLAAIVREAPNEPANVSSRVGRYLVSLLDKEPSKRAKSAKAMVDGLRKAAAPPVLVPAGDPTKMALAGIGVVAVAVVVVLAVSRGGKATPSPKPPVLAANDKPAPKPSAPEGQTPTPKAQNGAGAFAGVWYADLGTRFAEVTVDPGANGRLEATWYLRGTDGVATVLSQGDVSDDGKTVRLVDQGKTEGTATPGLETFVGKLSGNGSRIEGTRGPAEGTAADARLVRVDDLPLTPYANDPDGFGLQIPTSWTAESSQTGETRVTDIHPVGRNDVRLTISVLPEPDNRPLSEVETELEGGMAGYQQVSLNPDAAFAGRRGVSIEYRQEANGTLRGTRFLTYRGTNVFMVDASFPVKEEAIWAPVMEKLKGGLRIGG